MVWSVDVNSNALRRRVVVEDLAHDVRGVDVDDVPFVVVIRLVWYHTRFSNILRVAGQDSKATVLNLCPKRCLWSTCAATLLLRRACRSGRATDDKRVEARRARYQIMCS